MDDKDYAAHIDYFATLIRQAWFYYRIFVLNIRRNTLLRPIDYAFYRVSLCQSDLPRF